MGWKYDIECTSKLWKLVLKSDHSGMEIKSKDGKINIYITVINHLYGVYSNELRTYGKIQNV
ncbi:hypothetical protein [Methanothermococcus sp. Ax23]|uniref:hypothetical protein n=1 Tax=Methanothermococcus sp. Ax23 TaxID=3156486 RepID=UPI003BA26FFF